MCRFTLAVNRPKRDGQDTGADFIRIVVWGRQAENCNQYLAKGRKVAISGSITTGSYKNRDGQTVYTTEVTAHNVEFLGSANSENSRSNARNNGGNNNYQQPQNFAPQPQNFAPQGTQQSFDDIPDNFAAAEEDIPF